MRLRFLCSAVGLLAGVGVVNAVCDPDPCDANADCIDEGTTFTCACRDGFVSFPDTPLVCEEEQINSCLESRSSSYRCASGQIFVSLAGCGLNDADVPDIATCLGNVGRSTINALVLSSNLLTSATFSLLDGDGELLLAGLDSLEVLLLDRNPLGLIPAGAFGAVETLRFLSLGETQLGRIQEGAFSGLEILTGLHLGDAGITSLEVGAFEGLGNVTSLVLVGNELGRLASGVFERLEMLQSLNLADTGLTSIEAGAFNGLGSVTLLSLGRNQLSSIAPGVFEGLGMLRSLDLSFNNIPFLRNETFSGLGTLIYLDLSFNNIPFLRNETFSGLGTLIYLHLNNNALQEVEPAAFDGLDMLVLLNLGGNDRFLRCLPFLTILTSNPDLQVETGGVGNCGSPLSCLDPDDSNYRCAPGTTEIDLSACQLGDEDFANVDDACLVNAGKGAITALHLSRNFITNFPAGAIAGLPAVVTLDLDDNLLQTIEPGVFAGFPTLQYLDLQGNLLGQLVNGTFNGLGMLQTLSLDDAGVTSLEAGAFSGLASLTDLDLDSNPLGALTIGAFDGLEMLQTLRLRDMQLGIIAPGAFRGLGNVTELWLRSAGLTSIAAGAFDPLGDLTILDLQDNPDLQCIPGYELDGIEDLRFDSSFDPDGQCGCDPSEDNSCEGDMECCPEELVCRDSLTYAANACGDPHMTGFHGQKFDFTGEDGAWYCLLSDQGSMHLNMRVTAPVPGRTEITYITGLSILTTDYAGLEHNIVITVKDPHSLLSACPTSSDGSAYPCLADGALRIVLDGQEGKLLQPGTVVLGPGTTIDAVNLPGACRSFGFEHYWERKKLDYAQAGRRLADSQSMGEWVVGDPTVTNMAECEEYVSRAVADGGTLGLFNHQSEHASFRIVTPTATIRLSHGRLHQTATRDPSDSFDLPDHLTWQMNVAVDQNDVSIEAKGVLGETIVPRHDAAGDVIMEGMEAIRGEEQEYRVAGPLEIGFAQGMDQQ